MIIKMKMKDIIIQEPLPVYDKEFKEELKESIKEIGLMNPLTVSKDYILLDGRCRYEVLKQLGIEEVEVRIVNANEDQIKEAKIIASRRYVPVDPEEYRKQLIRVFKAHPEMSIHDLPIRLQMSPEWIVKKLKLGKETTKKVLSGVVTIQEVL